MTSEKGPIYVEEVVFLRSCGTSDHEILHALHVTPAALSRALYREGRKDLAAPFARIQWRERSAICPQCGGPRDALARNRTGLCYRCVVPLLSGFQAEATAARRAAS